MGTVEQDEPSDVDRCRRGKYRPGKALADEPRKISAMVQMRVGEHDGIDRAWVPRKALPVEFPKLAWTLKKAAVDKQPPVVVLEQVLRTGNRAGTAKTHQ
jgi:hypothetical protein